MNAKHFALIIQINNARELITTDKSRNAGCRIGIPKQENLFNQSAGTILKQILAQEMISLKFTTNMRCQDIMIKQF